MYLFSKRSCCDYMLLRLTYLVNTDSSLLYRGIFFIFKPKLLNPDLQFYGLSNNYCM